MKFIILAFTCLAAGIAKAKSLDDGFTLSNYARSEVLRLHRRYLDDSLVRLRPRASGKGGSSGGSSPEKQRPKSPPKKDAPPASSSQASSSRASRPQASTPQASSSKASSSKPVPQSQSPSANQQVSPNASRSNTRSATPARQRGPPSIGRNSPPAPAPPPRPLTRVSPPLLPASGSAGKGPRGKNVAALVAKFDNQPIMGRPQSKGKPWTPKPGPAPSPSDKGKATTSSSGAGPSTRQGSLSPARAQSPGGKDSFSRTSSKISESPFSRANSVARTSSNISQTPLSRENSIARTSSTARSGSADSRYSRETNGSDRSHASIGRTDSNGSKASLARSGSAESKHSLQTYRSDSDHTSMGRTGSRASIDSLGRASSRASMDSLGRKDSPPRPSSPRSGRSSVRPTLPDRKSPSPEKPRLPSSGSLPDLKLLEERPPSSRPITPQRTRPRPPPPVLPSLREASASESSQSRKSLPSRANSPDRMTSPPRDKSSLIGNSVPERDKTPPRQRPSPPRTVTPERNQPLPQGSSPLRNASPTRQSSAPGTSRQGSGTGTSSSPPPSDPSFLDRVTVKAGKGLKYAQDHPRKCVTYVLGTCSAGLFAASIGTGNDAANLFPKNKGAYATVFGLAGVGTGLAAAKIARTGEIAQHTQTLGITDEQASQHLTQEIQNVRATIVRAASSGSLRGMSRPSSTNDLVSLNTLPSGQLTHANTAPLPGSVPVIPVIPSAANNLPPVALIPQSTAVAMPLSTYNTMQGLNQSPIGRQRSSSPPIGRPSTNQPNSNNPAAAAAAAVAIPAATTPTTTNNNNNNNAEANSAGAFKRACKNAWDTSCKTADSVVSSAAKKMSWRKPEPPNPVRRRR